MMINWKLFVDCNKEEKAEKLLYQTKALIDLDIIDTKIESYHKGGYLCTFATELDIEFWSQLPYVALGLAQRIGNMWTVSGDVIHEFSAWSNESTVSGVVSAEVWAVKGF